MIAVGGYLISMGFITWVRLQGIFTYQRRCLLVGGVRRVAATVPEEPQWFLYLDEPKRSSRPREEPQGPPVVFTTRQQGQSVLQVTHERLGR